MSNLFSAVAPVRTTGSSDELKAFAYFRDVFAGLCLAAAERSEDFALGSQSRFRRTMQWLPESTAVEQGKWRAILAAKRAWRTVPAYRDFLAANGIKSLDDER